MKISDEQKEKLESLYQTFLNDPKILKMKEISMHRGSNCYEHSFKVAKHAIRMALRRRKSLDLEAILIGAILHDYYLYDWRKDRSKLKKHGSKHPYYAAENATRDFGISPKIRKIIETHMWPFNFRNFPNSTEAIIVMVADNHIATREAFTSKRFKSKRRDKYLKNISHLF